MKAGILLSFEGIDASGKNTQSKMLFDFLKQHKVRAEYISFPDYSTSIGKEIRDYLDGAREYNAETRHLLYAANRYEWKERIEERLRQGVVSVLNRYSESNLAYGVANGLSLSWLREVEGLMPKSDLVFYLKIPPEVSATRKGARDRFESDLPFLKRVSEVYDALVEPGRWFTLDGTRSMELVHYEIVKILENVFPRVIAPSEPKVAF